MFEMLTEMKCVNFLEAVFQVCQAAWNLDGAGGAPGLTQTMAGACGTLLSYANPFDVESFVIAQ